MKRLISLTLTFIMLLTLAACDVDELSRRLDELSETYPDATPLILSDSMSSVPEGVTVTHDIVYYEAGHDFTYGEGTVEDAHSAEEAAAHTVVTITAPGTYLLTGSLSKGQVAVDLGEDAKTDPNAVVTLILGEVDITCTVAPAVIFYNVYECGSTDTETATYDVDTSAAGANVIIADDSVNNISGSYVARIYKSVELSEDGTEVIDSKKLHKYDAAFYSKMSMNIDGGTLDTGTLNIKAENEGLDSELHLTMNGGNVNIVSGNDGINTNEDGVSVTTINDGVLNIRCDGSTGEGDGIDSNGWLVINGGTVTAQACATSGDAGIDSDMGIYLNGGVIMASGNMADRIAGGDATYALFEFAQPVSSGQSVKLKDANGGLLMMYTAENAFSTLILSVNTMTAGDYSLWVDDVQMAHGGISGGRDFGGRMHGEFDPAAMEGMEPPADFDPARREEMTPPDGFDRGMGQPEAFDPSAMEGMTPPDGFDRGMEQLDGEQSSVFTLAEGGNQFRGVGEYIPV
ncbi:MAG: carbohydrate-binding domain-containing protein, partial [Oscillospiraceae bacterium]|nr:carbohydrate-binding domain-containing protein [Oscillospiraceae bacterium]